MIPQVTAAPGTPEYGEQMKSRVDYQNMFPWGTPQNHPGTWGKIGHVLGTIGNVAGQLAPGIAEAIPGSWQNRQLQERQAAGWTKLGAETQEKQAQTEEAKARTGYLGAEEWKAMHPTATNALELFHAQNPDAPVQDFLKAEAAAKGEKESTDQALAAAIREAQDQGIDPANYPKVQQIMAARRTEKPETANQDRERYEGIIQNQRLGKPVTPEDVAWSKAYEKAATLTPFAAAAAQAPNRADVRSDRSYQIQINRLDKMRTPLTQLQNRMANLAESVNQNTPQADALIAPELLSIMAGGQASGLRMNEAEIARIVGGRSNWEGLKAAANQWSLDPKAALTITPEQRREVRALYGAVNRRVGEQIKHLENAEDKLNNTDDVGEMRKIMSDANQQFTGEAQREVNEAGGGGGNTSQPRVQQNSKGEYRYSTDGGKTWQMGKPPNQ